MNNIKKLVESQFIKKECELDNPTIVAAIITAAAKMARLSNIATETETLACLIELYGAEENQYAGEMPPQFVKSNIGYSIDFNDIGPASVAYDADEENYNALYTAIHEYIMKKENNTTKTM